MAVINGTSGADTLTDTSGNDTINGLAGNDVINGGHGGTDVVNGGDGRDSLQFMTATSGVVVDFVAGTAGTTSFTNIEKVVTGDFNDRLTGDAQAQNLTARAGADTLAGAGGVDTLWGGSGNDTFVFRETGTANADSIGDWSSGSDTLLLDGAVMTALGASGDFTAGDARFWASSSGTAHDADDRIIYNSTTRQIFYDADGNGSGAAQLIATLQSGATLVATDIAVEGGSGPAPIVGTEGNDTLIGTDGDDTIDGRGGNDSLIGGAGADSMVGGDGNDTLAGIWFGSSEQGEADVDTMEGGFGDDLYHVDNPDDVLSDTGGSDTVRATEVDWTLGAGFENLVISNDFSESSVIAIGNELDNRISVTYAGSHLEGGGGNDTLIGGGAQNGNELFGGEGNDSLVAGNDGDLMDGGAGNDTLDGGDVFSFTAAPGLANADQVLGFLSGYDLIQLDGTVHASAGITGSLSPNDARFASGAGFTSGQDASDRVIYNTTTGQLFYDSDGNGSAAAQLVATLEGAPELRAQDIVIVNGEADGLALTGTAGDDSLVGSPGRDTIHGLAGDDTIHGGGGRDLLVGGDGNDYIIRDDGTDRFAEDFADTLDGGLGDDVYDVAHGSDAAAVILDAGGIDTVIATNWTLGAGIENLTLVYRDGPGPVMGTGNELDNVIRADDRPGAGPQSLLGEDGNDTLIGHAGVDGLIGGAGDDWLDAGIDTGDEVFERLIGGSGNDSFVFHQPPSGRGDNIADFVSSSGSFVSDQLVLGAAGFTAIGTPGQFSASDERFNANASGTATDVSDRIIYNTSTGEVWYDADGSGAGAAVRFAILEGAPTLVARDIVVDDLGGGRAIDGTDGDDSLTGGSGDDTIHGFAGNDSLDGWVGDDYIAGGAGNDFVQGSSGDDTLLGEDGRDGMEGGAGNDLQFGGAGDDNFFMTLNSRSYGQDTVDGGFGTDNISFSGFNGSAVVIDLAAGTLRGGGSASDSAVLIGIEQASGTVFHDQMTGDSGANYFFGSNGNDTLDGAAGDDALQGGAGSDLLIGGAGNDFFRAEDGNDTQLGGDGHDEFLQSDFSGATPGDDLIDGGAGIDTVRYDVGSMHSAIVVDLAAGTSTGGGASGAGSSALAGIENVFGSEFSDSISGDSARNTLRGEEGSDTLAGRLGNDVLQGGEGADTFVFDTAPTFDNFDIIDDFASGTDRIRLDGGAMSELGASGGFVAGDSRFFAGAAAHDADDRVIYDTSNGQLWYDADGNGAGAGQLIAILSPGEPALVATDIEVVNGSASGQVINGTSGADTLADTAGNDTINGLAGNDTINGGSGGSDVVNGGDGRDTLAFMTATSAVVANFVTGTVTGGGPGTTSFTNIERVITGDFNDTLIGNAAAQNLTARAGADTLAGGGGFDTLWGGAGADTFIFRETGTANADTIGDWSSGSDEFALDNAAMGALGADGAFTAGDARFWASSTGLAHDANDRVVFNTSNGSLYYDADGNGSGAAQLIATVQAGATVVATDISVI